MKTAAEITERNGWWTAHVATPWHAFRFVDGVLQWVQGCDGEGCWCGGRPGSSPSEESGE